METDIDLMLSEWLIHYGYRTVKPSDISEVDYLKIKSLQLTLVQLIALFVPIRHQDGLVRIVYTNYFGVYQSVPNMKGYKFRIYVRDPLVNKNDKWYGMRSTYTLKEAKIIADNFVTPECDWPMSKVVHIKSNLVVYYREVKRG